MANSKALLLIANGVHPDGQVKWLPVDITHLDLAAAIGDGIERAENMPFGG